MIGKTDINDQGPVPYAALALSLSIPSIHADRPAVCRAYLLSCTHPVCVCTRLWAVVHLCPLP